VRPAVLILFVEKIGTRRENSFISIYNLVLDGDPRYDHTLCNRIYSLSSENCPIAGKTYFERDEISS